MGCTVEVDRLIVLVIDVWVGECTLQFWKSGSSNNDHMARCRGCSMAQALLVTLLTNKDISLIVRGRMYSSCVQSSTGMLHGSETWSITKENEVAWQRTEMRMVRWMCGITLQDRAPSKGLRKRETRIRWHNLGTIAKQEAMVRACAAKRRQWLGGEMYGVWSGGCQANR